MTDQEREQLKAQVKSHSTKALREQLGTSAKTMRTISDRLTAENRDFNTEERAEWDTAEANYSVREQEINDRQGRENAAARVAEIEAKLKQPVPGAREVAANLRIVGNDGANTMPTAADQAVAFGAWMRYQGGENLTETEERAVQACGVNPRAQFFTINRPVGMRQHSIWTVNGIIDYGANLSQFDPTKGGYTVPETMVRNIEIALLQYGGVRQVSEVITTSDGAPMTWPAADDTSNTGARIGESATQTTTTTANPSFKAKQWLAYAYTSNFILVPYGLLRDSAFNLAQIVGGMLGERVGRKTNTDFTTGAGASGPSGIVTDSFLGVTTASATAIAADELFDLVHSIDPAYRSMGCGWMMHDSILKAIRKLKDGEGRYLWQEGMSVGAPNMLLGYPYTINQDMQSSIATATKTMLFGLLSKYKIRDVSGIRLNRVNERFIETDNIGFNYISYHDGHLLDAGTHPVKHMLQA